MALKKRVLLKLTGELLLSPDKQSLSAQVLNSVIAQIKKLEDSHQFGIVIGGGNFFRGKLQGTRLGLTPSIGHCIGMLATMMNGLIIKDLLEQQGLSTSLFCALMCPEVGEPITPQAVKSALSNGNVLVFTGGTGNPFFTTDTSAVLRGLQMGAHEVWKGTHVDGVFSADPHKDAHAHLLKEVSYAQALEKKYGIMDAAAFALASEHNLPLRIFNIFTPDALLRAAHDESFGSIIK